MSFERMSTVEDAAAKDAQDDTVNTEVLMSQSLYHQYRKKAKRRRPGELGVLSPAPENSEDAPMVWERFRGFRKKMIEDYQVLLFHDEVAEWCLEDSVYTTRCVPTALGWSSGHVLRWASTRVPWHARACRSRSPTFHSSIRSR